MKQLVALAVGLVLSYGLIAQPTLTFQPQIVTAPNGDIITLDVVVNDFVGIVSMQYSTNWNPAAIEFQEVVLPGNLSGLSTGNFGTNNAAQGALTLSWLDPNVSGVTLANGTVIYSIRFKVLDASIGTDVTITGDPVSIEVLDASFNNVGLNVVPSMVNGGGAPNGGGTGGNGGGSGGNGGGGSSGLTISASSVSGNVGDQVCVDVSVSGFTDIVSLQYSMTWDPLVAEYVGVQGMNLNGLTAGNFGAGSGTLSLSWIDPNVTGVTVPDGTVIYQVCFNLVGSGGSSTVFAFGDQPTLIEVTNSQGQFLTPTFQNGMISINGNGGGGPSGLTISASSVSGNVGDQVCVDVSVSGFTDIVSLQYSMTWDPLVAEYVGVQGMNLNGLTAGNFGAGSGTLSLSWVDPNVTGVTVPDGTVIYQVCFNLVGSGGSSTVFAFGDQPTLIEVTNSQGQFLTPTFQNGMISITQVVGPDDFVIAASDVSGAMGDQVCVDVSVVNFTDVVSMQYSMHFDPAVVEFVSVTNFNLPFLSASNFGTSAAGQGTLTLSWLDNNITGISVTDGTVIYQVCFNLIADCGNSSTFSFDGDPTSVEITNVNGEFLDPVFLTGVIDIPCDTNPLSVSAQIDNVSCPGGSDGAITLTASGGTGSYTYMWQGPNGPLGNSVTISNLSSGTYAVTVTSGTEIFTDMYNVTAPPPIQDNAQVQHVTCAGEATGSIALMPSGGNGGPWTYQWNPAPGIVQGAAVQTGLTGGTYTVTIADGMQCTSVSQIEIFETPAISVQASVSNEHIPPGNDGAIGLTVTGGCGAYLYAWTGPNGFTATTEDISGLSAGTYTVVITDGCSCSVEQSFTVLLVQPLSVNVASVTPACAGMENGCVDLDVAGGVPPYTFSWSDPGIGNVEDPCGLAPGNYGVTVTDSGNPQSSISTSLLVGENQPPFISQVSIGEDMGSCNGSIELTVGSGSGNYSFNWSSGSGNPNTGLCEGTYSVTIVDNVTGCTTVGGPYMVTQPLVTQYQVVNATCADATDGIITLTISGGAAPYTVQVGANTYTVMNEGDVLTITDLAPNAYVISITDAINNSWSQQVQVDAPDPLVVSSVQVFSATEAGPNGRIEIVVEGGTLPYHFMWSNNFAGQNPQGLSAGCYHVTVQDANGCLTVVNNLCVDEFRIAGAEIDDVYCSTDTDGAITPQISGGMPPYECIWTDADGNIIPTSDCALSGVSAGTYTLTVVDSNGVMAVPRTFTVEATSPLDVQAEASTSFNGFNVSCYGGNNGEAQVMVLAGTPPYQYQWSSGHTEAVATNLAAGTYTVTVQDANGCIFVESLTLTQPPEINIDFIVDDVPCFDASDGRIEALVVGGVPRSVLPFYDYKWSNNRTTRVVENLRSGYYILTVTDRNGCRQSEGIQVNEPDPLIVTVKTEPDNGNNDGRAWAEVTGGTWPYFFFWHTGDTDSVLTDLPADRYFVEVTDSRGCYDEASGVVFPDDACLEVRAVITPQGDGLNEEFIIGCLEKFPENKLEIYNRWGQLVYRQENYDNTWKGTNQRGAALPPGGYFYVFEYRDPQTQQLLRKKGSITILR